MTKPVISVSILPQPSLRERVGIFLEKQLNYNDQAKIHIIEDFKRSLLSEIHREGLTDENLLLGLELNNYLRQINDSDCRLEQVCYYMGRNR